MKIIDISMTIEQGMPVYKNRKEKMPLWHEEKVFGRDGYKETAMKLNLHTGTHVDAPLHYLEDGADIASLPPESFMGKARVLEMFHAGEAVRAEDVMDMDFEGLDFVIFKTRNSRESRPQEFVYVDASAAEVLAGKDLRGVGIDALGIERNQPGHPTHKLLLGAGILIVEGLDLRNAVPGDYYLVVLPLRIKGAEAAPARAILIEGFTEEPGMVYNEEKTKR